MRASSSMSTICFLARSTSCLTRVSSFTASVRSAPTADRCAELLAAVEVPVQRVDAGLQALRRTSRRDAILRAPWSFWSSSRPRPSGRPAACRPAFASSAFCSVAAATGSAGAGVSAAGVAVVAGFCADGREVLVRVDLAGGRLGLAPLRLFLRDFPEGRLPGSRRAGGGDQPQSQGRRPIRRARCGASCWNPLGKLYALRHRPPGSPHLAPSQQPHRGCQTTQRDRRARARSAPRRPAADHRAGLASALTTTRRFTSADPLPSSSSSSSSTNTTT